MALNSTEEKSMDTEFTVYARSFTEALIKAEKEAQAILSRQDVYDANLTFLRAQKYVTGYGDATDSDWTFYFNLKHRG